MKPINTTCADCGGPMEEGFLLDNDYGSRRVVRWIEGAPEKSFLAGVKAGNFGGRRRAQVAAYRCAGCGLVKLYAREEV